MWKGGGGGRGAEKAKGEEVNDVNGIHPETGQEPHALWMMLLHVFKHIFKQCIQNTYIEYATCKHNSVCYRVYSYTNTGFLVNALIHTPVSGITVWTRV